MFRCICIIFRESKAYTLLKLQNYSNCNSLKIYIKMFTWSLRLNHKMQSVKKINNFSTCNLYVWWLHVQSGLSCVGVIPMLVFPVCWDDKHIYMSFRFLWPCIVSKLWGERKPKRCNNQMFIINTVSTCFGHHYAHLQENKDRVLLHVVCCTGCAGCGW